MIDFATSILGHDIIVQSTEGTGGSKQEVLIGLINRIEDTELRNVHVYEADILDPQSKAKINHGVAIYHMDTSTWRSTHEAFLALRSGPRPDRGLPLDI
ncbi:hypothetical protein NL676_032466 [Syzygium grande]|nr:hypothetical protein NL676_032466 [Syzygium grande]